MVKKTITIDGVEYNLTPVEKKEYEVLTLKDKNTGKLASYDKEEVDSYELPLKIAYKTREYWLECFLTWSQWEIYSVKRLSDGEVFTIGDIIGTIDYHYSLDKIVIDEKFTGGVRLSGKTGEYDSAAGIRYARKYPIKPILFTTEDGVGISVGNECFGVNTVRMICTGSYIWNKREYFGENSLSPDVKYFSTEEKAKDYLETEVKKYSIADIKKVYPGNIIFNVNVLIDKLKQL